MSAVLLVNEKSEIDQNYSTNRENSLNALRNSLFDTNELQQSIPEIGQFIKNALYSFTITSYITENYCYILQNRYSASLQMRKREENEMGYFFP